MSDKYEECVVDGCTNEAAPGSDCCFVCPCPCTGTADVTECGACVDCGRIRRRRVQFVIDALRAENERLRAALVQGFDLLGDAALTAMCAEVPSHDTIGKMTKWATLAAALLNQEGGE
jgi:hypothetical protein